MIERCKKIIIGFLITGIIAGSIGLPTTVQALGAEAVIETGPSLWQQIVNTINTGVSSVAEYSMEYKAYVLDTLATTVAKNLIRRITSSVVDWINNGFEGSPAFMDNPGGFFLDVADQITGEFLDKFGGPLSGLCNEFSIDIRLALAFKFHRKPIKRYECTLSKIISNVEKVGDNITVNGKNIKGFTGGDFNQGGWPAFVTMTTDTQNNPYGAYLEANSELSVRVANAKIEKDKEINNGKGFLSWRNPECKKKTEAHNKTVRANYQKVEDGELPNDAKLSGEAYTMKSSNDCPIETPGSLIAGGLENSANGPLRELELVDSINEIVSALVGSLITQIFQGGLKSISGSGSSDSTAYLRKVEAEAASTETTETQGIRSRLVVDLQRAIDNTNKYKDYKEDSLNIVLNVIDNYVEAQTCYASKPNPQFYKGKVDEIEKILKEEVRPIGARLHADIGGANYLIDKLTEYRKAANFAKTINELSAAANSFSNLQSGNQLTTSNEIVDAQRELDSFKDPDNPLQKQLLDAKRRLQECKIIVISSDPNANSSANH